MTYSDKLKELVHSNKKCISVRDVVHQFNVHISQARRILEDFLTEHNGDKKLSSVYVVSGTSKDSCDSYKSYKLAYAEADELEEIKKEFATVDSCSLFSVAEKDVEPFVEDADQTPVLDMADVSKYQKLTYILNDDIKLREDRVEKIKLILGLHKNDEEPKLKETKKEHVNEVVKPKKETNGFNKRSTNNKNKNNKKQTKLTGFDSKAVKNEKPEPVPEPEPMPDPFSEEEEEEEEKEKESETIENVERTPSPPPSPPKVKIEPMEEEPVQKVSKSKKRKRVRVFDSDEEDEEALALKILADDSPTEEEKPVKKSKKSSKPSQPMETKTVSEEFTDEDGYTQVRLVKKLVPVKNDDDEENVNANKFTKVKSEKSEKSEKSVDKKKKAEMDAEDEESKPKPKKLSKAAAAKKGQVSITNFFKPTAKD